MKSIRELYKIGRGPSSSHTMGPFRACLAFKEQYTEANRFKVFLYGSLSLTGRGHLTDIAVKEALETVDIVFSSDFVEAHPNTMDIIGYKDDHEVARERVYSIGGGDLRYQGRTHCESAHVYPHQTFKEIKGYCLEENITLFEYVERFEGVDIYDFLNDIWTAMNDSIEAGFKATAVLPGGLFVQRRAKQLYDINNPKERIEVRENRLVSAYAFAVNETNASGGTVVTAPTCGASGTMPAVLRFMEKKHRFSNRRILEALAVGGIIGNLIKHNASISGAEAGCQAEIGSACSMAAAAHASLFELTLSQIEYAAEIALEHHLGLTCDPIEGLVQIPCIERNAVAALRAIDACRLAYFLFDTRKIDFDTIVDTMFETGKDMPAAYRETSCGGLALRYKR